MTISKGISEINNVMTPFLLIIATVYGFDLLTKILIRATLPLGTEISVLPVFSITHIQNTGVAFGMFQGMNWLFLMVGILVVAGVIIVGIRTLSTDRLFSFILALVSGGALGNITDRLIYGKVTDFLDFYIGPHHWPAFNVADSAVCVGAGLLIWHSFRRAGKQTMEEGSKSEIRSSKHEGNPKSELK